jgi:hypothetical protein
MSSCTSISRAADWVTWKVFVAIVKVADRDVGEKFSATVTRTSFSPVPEVVLTDTQLTLLLAVHWHVDVVRTRTVPVPPVSLIESDSGVSWNEHGAGGGGVGAGTGVGGGGAGVGAGGAGGGGVGAGGVGVGAGGAGVAALDSCERVTRCPAIVTSADRGTVAVFGDTAT